MLAFAWEVTFVIYVAIHVLFAIGFLFYLPKRGKGIVQPVTMTLMACGSNGKMCFGCLSHSAQYYLISVQICT